MIGSRHYTIPFDKFSQFMSISKERGFYSSQMGCALIQSGKRKTFAISADTDR